MILIVAAAVVLVISTQPAYAVKDMRALDAARSVGEGSAAAGAGVAVKGLSGPGNTPEALKKFAKHFSAAPYPVLLISLAKFLEAVYYGLLLFLTEADLIVWLFYGAAILVWLVVLVTGAKATYLLAKDLAGKG